MALVDRIRRVERALTHRWGEGAQLAAEAALKTLSDEELDALILCYTEEGAWNRGIGLTEAQAELACDGLRKLKGFAPHDFRELGIPASSYLGCLGPDERRTGLGAMYQDLSEEELSARIAACRKAVSHA